MKTYIISGITLCSLNLIDAALSYVALKIPNVFYEKNIIFNALINFTNLEFAIAIKIFLIPFLFLFLTKTKNFVKFKNMYTNIFIFFCGVYSIIAFLHLNKLIEYYSQ